MLCPSNAQELLDFGLHGIAMSRYSGCWSGMKVVTDVVEGGGSVYVSPDSPRIVEPDDAPPLPAGGVHARARDAALLQEERLYHHKLHRVLAYARANGLNRITVDPETYLVVANSPKVHPKYKRGEEFEKGYDFCYQCLRTTKSFRAAMLKAARRPHPLG